MKKFFLFLCLTSLLACNSLNESDIIGNWNLKGFDDARALRIADAYSEDSLPIIGAMVRKFSFDAHLNLYPKHEFTYKLADEFFYGKWKFDAASKRIILTAKDIYSKEFVISFLVDKYQKDAWLGIRVDPANCITDKLPIEALDRLMGAGFSEYFKNPYLRAAFQKDRFVYINPHDDINAYENNEWRIKPLKAESKEEIRKRLKGNVKFLKLYLNDAIIRHADEMEFSNLIKPLKIAGNGIGLSKKEDVLKNWIDVFYNEEQAMEAYDMLTDAFKGRIQLHKKERWLEMDYDLLCQLYQLI